MIVCGKIKFLSIDSGKINSCGFFLLAFTFSSSYFFSYSSSFFILFFLFLCSLFSLLSFLSSFLFISYSPLLPAFSLAPSSSSSTLARLKGRTLDIWQVFLLTAKRNVLSNKSGILLFFLVLLFLFSISSPSPIRVECLSLYRSLLCRHVFALGLDS